MFPVYFLRSFAYAGISVVVLATIGALVILPAVLNLLGTRVNALPVRIGSRRGRGPAFGQAESPFWRRVADAVVRRPIAAGLPVVIILIVLGLPFAHVHFGTPDDRVLPTSRRRPPGRRRPAHRLPDQRQQHHRGDNDLAAGPGRRSRV